MENVNTKVKPKFSFPWTAFSNEVLDLVSKQKKLEFWSKFYSYNVLKSNGLCSISWNHYSMCKTFLYRILRLVQQYRPTVGKGAHNKMLFLPAIVFNSIWFSNHGTYNWLKMCFWKCNIHCTECLLIRKPPPLPADPGNERNMGTGLYQSTASFTTTSLILHVSQTVWGGW